MFAIQNGSRTPLADTLSVLPWKITNLKKVSGHYQWRSWICNSSATESSCWRGRCAFTKLGTISIAAAAFLNRLLQFGFSSSAWSYKQPSRLAVLAPGYLAGSFIFRVIKEMCTILFHRFRTEISFGRRKISCTKWIWRSDLSYTNWTRDLIYLVCYRIWTNWHHKLRPISYPRKVV